MTDECCWVASGGKRDCSFNPEVAVRNDYMGLSLGRDGEHTDNVESPVGSQPTTAGRHMPPQGGGRPTVPGSGSPPAFTDSYTGGPPRWLLDRKTQRVRYPV